MNYKKWTYDNQKILGYTVLQCQEEVITLKCNKCGAIKKLQMKSLYRNNSKIHNWGCAQYYLDIARSEIGKKAAENFHSCYRRAHERCFNPNCKDYDRYKGKFGFDDFCNYFTTCYEIYKEALQHHDSSELSIDRIDSKGKYEPGNVRFVTMRENLQNKTKIKPVTATNVQTGEIITGVSFGDLADKMGIGKSRMSGIHRAYLYNRLYLNQWKIEVC